ncbi:unnamed protein product [Musa acuminata subsp. malaccensis]|uniref:(wild Malaysian banana) hypothetical protein n=1 Tax=Musa acuminata subsp. malaccensis TaxID=214687 RepID=A0A804IC39_MUSAM|nr:unnamed protein product [Musa acuminata subsp. malaccensis]
MRTKGSETSCSSMGSAAGVQFLPKLVCHEMGKAEDRWIIYLRSGLKRGNCSPKRRKLLGMKEIKHNSMMQLKGILLMIQYLK